MLSPHFMKHNPHLFSDVHKEPDKDIYSASHGGCLGGGGCTLLPLWMFLASGFV